MPEAVLTAKRGKGVSNMMMLAAIAWAAVGCATQTPSSASVAKSWPITPEGKKVLIVWNKQVPDGKDLGEYYASKRGIPKDHIVMVSVVGDESMGDWEYKNKILPELKPRLEKLPDVDYIVLMKGMPLRMWDEDAKANYSLDSYLATMNMSLQPMVQPSAESVKRISNPYFNKDEPFSAKKYGFYLVTRLDGYTFADAKRLVDNSMKAKEEKGLFFFDSVPNISNDGYGPLNASMVAAGKLLGERGFQVQVDRAPDFIMPREALMGYSSWGSNDQHFDKSRYQSAIFKPGALAETFVSTSARTMKPVTEGQSVITDLIKNGVTGVKGYVNEPYTMALARPNILFDRYTRGYNLAESFSMASPLLKWRDVVFGDPLCRPYKK